MYSRNAVPESGSSARTPEGGEDPLIVEQKRLERRGRLRWLHWLVIALSGVLTLLAWHYSTSALETQIRQRFETHASDAIDLFAEKLHTHADLLRASAGLLEASEEVTVGEWRRYTDALSLSEQFPAISGLGVIYRVPRESAAAFVDEQRAARRDFDLRPVHTEPLHLPLSLIAPRALEERVLGFDLAHDRVRRETIVEAMRGGTVRITAPIELVGREGLGVLMVAPFDESADSTRRGGVVVASMGPAELAYGTLAPGRRQVALRVSDGGAALHDEHGGSSATSEEPTHTLSRRVSLYGRVWDFDVRSTWAFDEASASLMPTLILVSGIGVECLLLTLFVVLSRANRQGLSFAERLTAQLRAKRAELEASNEELERFAQVASHDLKSPLASIRGFADLIGEELDDYGDSADARQCVHESLDRVKRQSERGRSLIDGVLAYSRVGQESSSLETLDIAVLIDDIGEGLGLDDGRLTSTVETPLVETHRTRLEQVLANLIDNAAKYHPDPGRLRVEVRVRMDGAERCRISVADNGPGIDERDRDRVFELFATLGSKEGVDSTGVGLSIVRKTIERLGGRIALESEVGRGTTFVFDWPARPVADRILPKAA